MKKSAAWRKILSFVLAIAICLSSPAAVFAEEIPDDQTEQEASGETAPATVEITDTVDVETSAGKTETVDVTIKITESVSDDGSKLTQYSANAGQCDCDHHECLRHGADFTGGYGPSVYS